jgi:hypothetical protein
MAYCTILTDGKPLRFYPSKEAALRAAKRHFTRTQEGVEVVWCKDGVPKVWLAFVTPLGTELSSWWEKCDG